MERRTAEKVQAAKNAARADKDRMIRRYVEQRHSIRRIADDYNIHHTWVTKWFKEWGVDLGSQRSVKAPAPPTRGG